MASDRQPGCGDGQAVAAAGRMAHEPGAAADAREAPLREWLAGQGGAWHADLQLFARPGRWEGEAHLGLAARAPLEAGTPLLRVPPRAILASAGAADALAACPVRCSFKKKVALFPCATVHTDCLQCSLTCADDQEASDDACSLQRHLNTLSPFLRLTLLLLYRCSKVICLRARPDILTF